MLSVKYDSLWKGSADFMLETKVVPQSKEMELWFLKLNAQLPLNVSRI
jgi:hypothetical protein